MSALHDADPEVRRSAAIDLAQSGEPAAVAGVPVLVEALGAASGAVRRYEAAQSLATIGAPAVAALRRTLASPQSPARVRAGAAHALYRADPSSLDAVLAALGAALRDDDLAARSDAAWALGRIGQPAAPAVPALLAALRDEREVLRGDLVGAAVHLEVGRRSGAARCRCGR